uniref:hypothetical protein n=1 Tax=Haloprofundus halophilus TaxID=2283527 RepID=UPI00130081B4
MIKLCGVFPQEGLPSEVAERHGVDETYSDLQKKLHGAVLTWISKGYVLTGVTPDDEQSSVRRDLLRQFWNQYDTDDVNAKYAVKAFADYAIDEKIFESKRGTLTGWATGGGFDPIDSRLYKLQTTGTFNGRYPKRVASLIATDQSHSGSVSSLHDELGAGFNSPDVGFNFVLDWQSKDEGRIEKVSEREYTFVLNGLKEFEELPNGLQYLRESMNPEEVTPFLMLSLTRFIDEQDLELDASEEQNLEALQDRLVLEAINELFDKELIHNAPFEIRRAGVQTVEKVFEESMKSVYEDYETLLVSTQYSQLIGDYINFLHSLDTVSLRRGSTPLETTKKDLASRFNLKGTSAFRGRVKKQYANLLELEEWDGQNATARAKLHPFEEYIINLLEDQQETLSYGEFLDLAYERGYREEEVEVISQLLGSRGLLEVNDENELALIETEIEISDVSSRVDQCESLVDRISELDEGRIRDEDREWIQTTKDELENLTNDDGEQLEIIDVHARQFIERMNDVVADLHNKYKSECQDTQREIERTRRGFTPSHVDDEIQGAVRFVGNLNDVRTRLKTKFVGLKRDLTDLDDTLSTEISEKSDPIIENAEELKTANASVNSTLSDIKDERDDLVDQAEALKQWKSLTTRTANVKRNIISYSEVFDNQIEEEDQIEEFIANVAEQLTNNPSGAITNVKTFTQRLEQIENSYTQRKRERREVFDEKKEILKDILQTATGQRSRGLRRAKFNIDDPDQSRKDLMSDFREAYTSQVLEKIVKDLENSEQDLEYARIVGAGSHLDENPSTVSDQIGQLQRRKEKLEQELSRFTYEQIGDETTLGEEGNEILTGANDLRSESREFLAEKEPTDTDLKELLEEIQERDKVQFKKLLMDFHGRGEEIDPETLLERINELFQLNQVDIQISSRRR